MRQECEPLISSVWMPTLFSLAVFVFLAISGRDTTNRQATALSFGAYVLSFVFAVLAFVGVLRMGPQTYLLSLFHTSIHEGFSVDVLASVWLVILYGVLAVLSLFDMRRIGHDGQEGASSHYTSTLQRAWFAFGISMILLSPTLSQALVGFGLVTIGVVVNLALATKHHAIEVRVVTEVLVVSGFILQTLATWVAWSMLHTVQLTVISHIGPAGSKWSSQTWLVWVWLLGVVLQCVALMLWMRTDVSKQKASAEQPEVNVERTGFRYGVQLRLTMFLVVGSGAYLWLVWSVVVVAPWMIVMVVVALILALFTVAKAAWQPSPRQQKER